MHELHITVMHIPPPSFKMLFTNKGIKNKCVENIINRSGIIINMTE